MMPVSAHRCILCKKFSSRLIGSWHTWCHQFPRCVDNLGQPRSRRPGSVRPVRVPSAFGQVSSPGHARESTRAGTYPLWTSEIPTTLTCLLICIRAWHPISGVPLPDASPIQLVAGQGVSPAARSQRCPCSAMVQVREPLHLVHAFYFRVKASRCQEIDNVNRVVSLWYTSS